MNKILVTGGAGFIGSYLVKTLLNDQNNQVTVVDNLILGTTDNLQSVFENPNFSFLELDVNNKTEMSALFLDKNFDIVYHLAANSDISKSHADPSIDFNHTFLTTVSVLEYMRISGTKKIIFASTSAIFGEADGLIHENYGPLVPISHYGAGKLASEAFIYSYAHNYQLDVLMVRFPNVVGGNSTHGVIYDFLKKLKVTPDKLVVLGNGKQEKSYLHVSDLVHAILFCSSQKKKQVDVFHLGGIDTITVAKIAEIVVELTGGKSGIEYTGGEKGWVGDVAKFQYDIGKILQLGWKPRYSSEEAVRLAVQELKDSI